MTTLYGIIFAVSLLMIVAYFLVDRKRDTWLLLLFNCVVVSDLGYFLLAVAKNLDFALSKFQGVVKKLCDVNKN